MTNPATAFRRRLPGYAWRDKKKNDAVVFLKGYVIYSSSRVQWVETDSKIHPLISLIGETFLYWCRRCDCNVYEQEVMMMGRQQCPFCSGPIARVERGQYVRLHYRFASDGSWASWWAERWER